ncbi:MAG: magnesium transporter [Candidatus Woesearchaeota archaeon]|jgi:mgtE-like transporter
MKIFDMNFKEIFFSQIVSVAGGLIAGTVLAIYTEKILLIPSMLILLPGFLEMRANITAPLASRLSSGLFLGVIHAKSNPTRTKIIQGNVIASFVLSGIVSLLLGLIVFFVNYFFLQVYTPKLIVVVLFAGILANAIEIPLTLFATFYLFKKGHDPNNIMGPFLTSSGDIISIISILLALVVVI